MSSSVTIPLYSISGPKSSSGSIGSGGEGRRCFWLVGGDGASTEASGPGEAGGGLEMVLPLGGAGSEVDLVGPGGGRETTCGGYPELALIN